jgi:adhesin/invasin
LFNKPHLRNFGATLSLSPTEAAGVANSSPITLTATVRDAQGGGIAAIPVDFRLINGQAFLEPFRVTTNNSGQAVVTVSSDTLGTATIEAQVDTLTPTVQAMLTFNPSEPSRLTLSSSSDSLSLNGETTVTAIVKDAQGHWVKKDTPVQFNVTGAGTITANALTDSEGKAEATFSATTEAGLATITATAGAATDSLNLTVQAGNAGTIEVSQIDPQVIGIVGSGVIQSTTIEFFIKDSLGNPVADGTAVDFALGTTTLGGGETLSTEGESGTTAIGRTLNGRVSVTLKSGAVAGNIDVIATVNETISTVARVTIVGSVPDIDHLSLAVEFHNIAGGVRFGLQNKITAYVGDRFGNIIPDGTAVSFITEGGTIGTSIGSGAFTTTTEFGQATAVLQSANPTTPALGGTASLQSSGYQCGWPYTFINNATPAENLCGNPGLVTIVAYSTGSESFIDTNGNGQFDLGIDQHSHSGFLDENGNQQWDHGEKIVGKGDLSEPYIDGNDNFTFDSGELYIDVNNNGQFDGPDGIFQNNTTIWHSTRVLFSAETRSEQQGLTITPTSFAILNGGSETFTVSNISDIYGNTLVKGSQVRVTTNNGVLGGTTEFTFGDNIQAAQAITFTLSSVPCQITNEEGQQIQQCPSPEPATITVTITSSGNGDESLVISGMINLEN